MLGLEPVAQPMAPATGNAAQQTADPNADPNNTPPASKSKDVLQLILACVAGLFCGSWCPIFAIGLLTFSFLTAKSEAEAGREPSVLMKIAILINTGWVLLGIGWWVVALLSGIL